MRWIKASERLPVNAESTITRWYRNGYKIDLMSAHYIKDWATLNHMDLDDIEWLDENFEEPCQHPYLDCHISDEGLKCSTCGFIIDSMDNKTVQPSNLPLRIEGAYIVIAYCYGHRDGHSYLVDVCGGIDTASERAEEEANERGGKYSVVVFAKNRMTEEIEEVYEAKCPEHYTKGTHPFIAKKDHDEQLNKLQAACKAVLSETMYFEVGEEGEHFEDSETYKKLEHLVNNYNLPNVIEES